MNTGSGAESIDHTQLSTWSPQARAARGVLTVIIEGVEQNFNVFEAATVGTAVGNPIRIVHPTVSRIHAELRGSSHGIWLRDFDSTNGCRVNGLLTKEALLPDNATLGFGDVEGRFAYTEPASVPVAETGRFGEMLGVSNSMRRLFLVLEQCARVDAPVLLSGEQGSGKSLAARSIHAQSSRGNAALWSIDCAALPSEASLDWIVRTLRAQPPLIAGTAAERPFQPGTLILDEVSELPLQVQSKLVRWLEGKAQADDLDRFIHGVRLIATSQRDLRELVNRGAFREDLYFRIAVIPVQVPPLRERVEDIPLLARYFLGRHAWPAELSLEQMQQQPWLGNVRELKNTITRVVYSAAAATTKGVGESGESNVEPTPEALHDPASGGRLEVHLQPFGLPNTEQPLRSFREQWTEVGEQRYLQALLERTRNNVPEAARLAQVDRTYVYRLIRRHRR